MLNRIRFALSFLAACLGSLSLAPNAGAQTTGWTVDDPTVTVGTGGHANFAAGYCTTAALACTSNFGSISAPTVPSGLSIIALVDLPAPPKAGDPYLRTQLAISGFSADPGQSWLARLDCSGITYPGAAANYLYSAGRATWFWPKVGGAQPAFQGRTSVTCNINRPGPSAWVRPKYKVVGLTYAPPGSASNATYVNAFRNGTSTSHESSFVSGISVSVSYTSGGSLFGIIDGSSTSTWASDWSQSRDDSSKLTVNQETSTSLVVPGPASSAAGVNHDFDTIYVWLNPAVFTMVHPNSVIIGGFGYDMRDTVTGMDVVPLTVGQLRGTQPILGQVWGRLNRTWDPVLGGLTTVDFQEILQANPFANNPNYNPNTDPTRRFELPLSGNPPQPTNLIFNYIPAPPGAQPTAQLYSSTYTSTSDLGKGARDTHRVSHSVDHTASGEFLASLSFHLKSSSFWEYTNRWSNTTTSATSQTASLRIVPPSAADNYAGPTAIQVWKDNVYGTFMFYPQN